mgnify:CR=1 FL=1
MPKAAIFMSSNRNAKLVGVFFLALLVFNFPLLEIFGKEKLVFGLPLLYVYIFVAWSVLIIVVQQLFRNPGIKN